MAYSRWMCSAWYTYWSTASGLGKGDQILDICTVKSFTYKQLTEGDLEALAEECRDGESDAEIAELVGYFREFIKDVDDWWRGLPDTEDDDG